MRYAPQTSKKIEEPKAQGFEIVENKQWDWDKRKKNEGREVIRVALTNSRTAGYVKRAIWAVK